VNVFGIIRQNKQNSESDVLFKQIHIGKNPFEVFAKLSENFTNSYILESAIGPEKLTEYSFIGFDPRLKIKLINNQIKIIEKKNISTYEISDNKFIFHELKNILNENSTTNNFNRLVGGLVGFISYDIIRYWENIAEKYTSMKFPDFEFGLYDEGIIFDHKNHKTYYYYTEKNRINDVKKILKNDYSNEPIKFTNPKSNISKEAFQNNVNIIKEYIKEGDIFQAVLSKKYEFKIYGNLINVYKELRKLNPSPYMYYYKSDDLNIIGASPEMLVRMTGRKIETFPIAGTRPRLNNQVKNAQLTKELLADEKENAEHVMLVDLARNDVGKIAQYGTVKVPNFRQVHQFSHVQHIVSKVIGEIRPNLDAFDAIKAIFPAGTVSGAPKVRAMEIIQELEGDSRGPYAGALGYFSKNMSADFAIAIRTLVVKGNDAYIQAGAGIVADSIPKREWDETEQKASALISSLKIARGIIK